MARNTLATRPEDLNRAIALVRGGKPHATIAGTTVGGINFRGRADLMVVREAWDRGADFEAEADGFGAGAGTLGDWSAIRDSTPAAIAAMTRKALRYVTPTRTRSN
jgi:hypothetical protein